MRTTLSVIRPDTLVEGRRYLLRIHQEVVSEYSLVPVIFYQYDPCPAIVIVLDDSGQKVRILRDDLYADSCDSQNGTRQSKQNNTTWNNS